MYQNGTERAKQELSLLARIEENIDILLLNSYQSTSTSKSKEILPIGPSYMPITTSFTPVVSSVGHILIQPERSSTPLSNHQLQKRKSDDSIDRPTLYTSSSVGATYSSLSTIVAKSLIPKEKKVSKQ